MIILFIAMLMLFVLPTWALWERRQTPNRGYACLGYKRDGSPDLVEVIVKHGAVYLDLGDGRRLTTLSVQCGRNYVGILNRHGKGLRCASAPRIRRLFSDVEFV